MTKPVMLEQKDVELIQKALNLVVYDMTVYKSKMLTMGVNFDMSDVERLQNQLKMELLWWSAGK